MLKGKKVISQKSDDVEANTHVAAISYILFLFVVPLFLKRNSKFAQFHAKQGLLLFMAEAILTVVGIFPILGWFVAFCGWIIAFSFALIGILKALNGEYWVMPLLGEQVDKLNL